MKALEKKLPLVDTFLKSIGQIMLQENTLTGLLFLVGIFYGGWEMGVGATLAVITGTVTARVLGYDKEEIKKGLYGFSAALVGVALTFYFQAVWIVWISVVFGSALATIIQHWFIVKKIPVFTLPFILVTWGIMYCFQHAYPVEASRFLTEENAVTNSFSGVICGYGQVIFQGSIFAGLIFVLGVLVNASVTAFYGLTGAAVAGILATFFSAPADAVAMGLYTYNAVLCAIVFAGTKRVDALWALIAVVFSVLINLAMVRFGITVLTFPFVAATCFTLFLRNRFVSSVTV